MDNLEQAYQTYIKRQAREEHPDGKFDNGGRWYPSKQEHQKCCDGIRSPSRSFPYSYMTHCRTAEHIARLHDVEPKSLKSMIAKKRPPAEREGGDDYYKAVAVADDGRLVSIFDGETEYRIGETLKQAAHQDHKGGYYVYDSPDKARRAAVPDESKLKSALRKILRVRAQGSYCRYGDKLAFSQVTPMEVVSDEQ